MLLNSLWAVLSSLPAVTSRKYFFFPRGCSACLFRSYWSVSYHCGNFRPLLTMALVCRLHTQVAFRAANSFWDDNLLGCWAHCHTVMQGQHVQGQYDACRDSTARGEHEGKRGSSFLSTTWMELPLQVANTDQHWERMKMSNLLLQALFTRS